MPARIAIDGEAVSLSGPAEARARGIGMVHQHFKLVKPFTVAENILLANPQPALSLPASKRSEPRSASRRTNSASHSTPIGGSTSLTVAEQQQVEIIKVLVGGRANPDPR